MPTRPSRLALPLLLALAAAPPALAGDEAAAAARRLATAWSERVDDMDAAAVDAHRAALLEPVGASADPESLEALLSTARDRAGQLLRFRTRLKDLDERDRRRAEEEKAGGDEGTRPRGPKDAAEAERRIEENRRAAEDRERIPGRIAREERWQPRLAEAAGRVLDAVPDADFGKAAPRLKELLGDPVEGWDGWMADALGRSRKERTARLLLEVAGDALGEYRKALAARVKPARELDRINDEINDRVGRYLEKRQKEGDFSGQYPSNLTEGLLEPRAALESEVFRLTSAMDAAATRRRTARTSLGRMLAGAPEDGRGRLLDLLEKEVLGGRDFEGRCFAIAVVGPCPGDRAMKALREAAKDVQPEVVVAAMDALPGREEAEAVEILGAALADARWQVRAAAAAGLGASGRSAAVPFLLKALAAAEGRGVDDLRAALVRLTGKELPGVAAAWEEWWAKAGPAFKGPRDPGAGAAAGEGGAPGGEAGKDSSAGERLVSFYGIETRSERLLFVLDFSGSMAFPGSETDAKRKKVDVLYEEMRKTLAGLPDGAKFNIVGFSSDVRVWRKGAAARDAKVAKEAMDWIEKQKVVGSTNIYDALETGFRMMGVGAAADRAYQPAYDTVFFMTDGVPTSGKVTDKGAILAEVLRWNEGRKIRIHVVGMGGKAKGGRGPHPGGPGGGPEDIDRDFLQKLADQNDGQAVFR